MACVRMNAYLIELENPGEATWVSENGNFQQIVYKFWSFESVKEILGMNINC